MTQFDKVLYTAKVHTTGGRNGGSSKSSDGRLDIWHSTPGAPGIGICYEILSSTGTQTATATPDNTYTGGGLVSTIK